jgi:hypothetical protein
MLIYRFIIGLLSYFAKGLSDWENLRGLESDRTHKVLILRGTPGYSAKASRNILYISWVKI